MNARRMRWPMIMSIVAALGSLAAVVRADEPTASVKAVINGEGGEIGAVIRILANVHHAVKGNAYQLYYQLRVHTKKGELGALLGTKENPQGKAVLVKEATGDGKTISFDESVDVTRGALSGMTNFKPFDPAKKGYYDMVVRVEPQVYDVTAKKYLTPGKTSAVILIAFVGDDGNVVQLQPLAHRLTWSGTEGRSPAEYLKVLADLDVFDTLDNGIEGAIATVLTSKSATPEAKLSILRAAPTGYIGSKSAHAFNMALDELLKGDDAKLKAQAQKIVDAAKNK